MYQTVLDAIGNTPLVSISFDILPSIFAKLEYTNPGGSVKDRSSIYMVEQAEKMGLLKPGGTIVDASSGNHGIAIAMIGAARGYKVVIVVSEKISKEKLQTMQAYNAQVIVCPVTDCIDDPEGYHSVAVRMCNELPNAFMPNQYFNLMNTQAHYTLLGPEVWEQTDGTVTHFFAGAGTGGTVTGVGRYLKEQNPNVKIIAVDSINSYRATKGSPKPYQVEGMGIDFDSPVIDYKVIDDVLTVSDNDAIAMLQLLASKGFLVGPSSGAVAHAAYQYAKNYLSKNDRVVIIFGDSGRAYLSKGFYSCKEAEVMRPVRKEKTITI